MLAEELDLTEFVKLRSSPFSKGLSDEQCYDLATVLETRFLKPGEILLREGEYGDCMYIVVSGALAVLKDFDAHSVVVSAIRPGEIAGAMGLVGGEEHSATLRAEGSTELLVLPRDRFEGLIKTNPELVYGVMRLLFRSVHNIVRTMNNHYVQLTNYITKQNGRY